MLTGCLEHVAHISEPTTFYLRENVSKMDRRHHNMKVITDVSLIVIGNTDYWHAVLARGSISSATLIFVLTSKRLISVCIVFELLNHLKF